MNTVHLNFGCLIFKLSYLFCHYQTKKSCLHHSIVVVKINSRPVGLMTALSSSSGGAVLHHLLEWVQNGHADKYVSDILQHSIPHDSPSYWPAVSNEHVYIE